MKFFTGSILENYLADNEKSKIRRRKNLDQNSLER